MNRLLIFITFLFFSCMCLAEPLKAPTVDERVPLKITSEKVKVFRDKGEILFSEKAQAEQGEMEILSNEMVVKYTEDENKKINILGIDIEGNTKLFAENILATGDSGFYDLKRNLVILKGNVVINEQGVIAYGDEFEYNTITRKTKILSNKKADDRVIIILEDIEELEQRIEEGKDEEEK